MDLLYNSDLVYVIFYASFYFIGILFDLGHTVSLTCEWELLVQEALMPITLASLYICMEIFRFQLVHGENRRAVMPSLNFLATVFFFLQVSFSTIYVFL